MAYKDKDKQREANRERQRRHRRALTMNDAVQGLIAKGVTNKGVTVNGNDTCRQQAGRHAKEAERLCHAKPVTLRKCKYCGKQLEYAVLECCYDCALKQSAKPVSPSSKGHILSSRPTLEFTGSMTASELLNYRPASELSKGQYNPVSKPGDEHYV